MILALLNKPDGRGSNKCWQGFLFDTDVQSEVEQFMIEVFHSEHYFLTDPNKLEKNSVGNYIFNDVWVMAIPVHVKESCFELKILLAKTNVG